MLCPRYDESSCQSYELLYHLIGPEKNVKSLKDSGWSPFLSKISSVFEVFLPMIPIQTLIRRLATKANISYYCWTLITSNQGWIEVLRMKKEGEKYRETQVSRTGATCHILSANLVHSFFVFSLFKLFWARFLPIFDPPLCLYVRQRSPFGP